jgi:hypothetical protein
MCGLKSTNLIWFKSRGEVIEKKDRVNSKSLSAGSGEAACS